LEEADTHFISSVLPDCSRVIVTAGALTREKDMGTAIKAYSLAAKKIGDPGMLIMGEGPERRRLERLGNTLKAGRLVFAGYREPTAPIYKASHLFLLTSTSEGLNTSAIEAAACGLPLVVSDVGGLREIAEHGYNGLLCPPGDPERFAEAIVEIYRDEAMRAFMAEQSMKRAARFDIDDTAKKTVEVYRRVLAG
jgi:1,4-alpha-glucan branching enzyme